MRAKEFISEDIDSEEDLDYSNLPSVNDAEALRPELAKVAQVVYDEWDEEDMDTYAGGGICHFIADEFCSVLDSRLHVNCASVTSTHEQHVYVIGQFREGVFSIDLHHSYYETGGGFSWKKIPNVVLNPRDISFYKVSPDPSEFDEYVGDY